MSEMVSCGEPFLCENKSTSKLSSVWHASTLRVLDKFNRNDRIIYQKSCGMSDIHCAMSGNTDFWLAVRAFQSEMDASSDNSPDHPADPYKRLYSFIGDLASYQWV